MGRKREGKLWKDRNKIKGLVLLRMESRIEIGNISEGRELSRNLT